METLAGRILPNHTMHVPVEYVLADNCIHRNTKESGKFVHRNFADVNVKPGQHITVPVQGGHVNETECRARNH
jgi:hypothetical protein